MEKNGRITAYIHMDAVEANFKIMKESIGNTTKMVAVIKSDGYGHGAVPIARKAENYDYIWGFAVAAVSEALELRNAGISKPILILGYAFEEDYEEMVRSQIRPAIFSYEMAEAFNYAAEKLGVRAPIHLVVDTGMSRIGFADNDESLLTIARIARLKHLKLEGIFTHFARADERDKTHTRIQLDRFSGFCSQLAQQGITGMLRHCSNSAGILEFPTAHMDMVRAGISIYGIYPSDEMDRTKKLSPVMELKSHVIHIKEVPAGTAISYGGTFVSERPMQVATIPVGYGDGYPRSLSSKGCVLIHGTRCPILGRICMDQFMVDVTSANVHLMDEVTLLGRDGEDEITVDELGSLSGRFPYEFVCVIGKRVPRVYLMS